MAVVMPATVPTNEPERLLALHARTILDSEPEPAYDDLARLAAAVCATPIALVNLVDAERLWTKARVGEGPPEIPRAESFCAEVVAGGELLAVTDLREHPIFASHPLVVAPDGLRAYAGAPIVTADGFPLGTVCVADHRPRVLSPRALDALSALARQAAQLLELRRVNEQLRVADAELHRHTIEDQLTGLSNRTLMDDRLVHALRGRLRTGRDVGLLFCDLVDFRAINERFGHREGDELLRVVAARLADVARGSDTIARFAGDEFAVVCPELAVAQDITIVSERMRAAVEQPLQLGDTTLVPRVRIGAVVASPGEDAADLLRRAMAEAEAAHC